MFTREVGRDSEVRAKLASRESYKRRREEEEKSTTWSTTDIVKPNTTSPNLTQLA